MWKMGLRPRYSFSGNICFKFSAFYLCSVCILLQTKNIKSFCVSLLTSGFCAKNSCRESGSVSNTSPSTCTHSTLLKIPHVYLALLKKTSSSHLARTKGPVQISHTTGPETFLILLSYPPLKGAEHENFGVRFFTLSDPIWLGDLGTEAKDCFCHQFSPDFDVFLFSFLPHADCSVFF